MRCEEVRRKLVESWPQDVPAPFREHLIDCPGCAAYARDAGTVQTGFRMLAEEPIPEPSWGFTERLLRRLDESRAQVTAAEEFFERVGRRVVYVAGLLAIILVLVLTLPSSGPLRGPTAAEIYMAQSEVSTLGTDQIFADEPTDEPSVLPASPQKGGTEDIR